MVQVVSASTLRTSGNSSMCGSSNLSGRHSRLINTSQQKHISFGVDKLSLWYQGAQILSSAGAGHSDKQSLRVKAGWLFKGGEKGSDASSERSENANEDILIFFFQLDLATQVQRALNLEEYEIAQQLRNKLTEVEAEVIKQQQSKVGTSSKSEAQDIALSMLRLRSDLQNAVQSENYALAAKLRDDISKLEAESLAASAKAQLYENAQYAFRLGQKVKHKKFGYRGVICGMDPVCSESSSWKEIAHVEKLIRGADQPFYQVLVDVYSDPNLLVTYVPEEHLLAPEKPDKARFDHPYISFLFYGMDGAGDFIPIKQLREKYNKPRHELPYDPTEEENGEDDA